MKEFSKYFGVAEPPCPVEIEPLHPLNRATPSNGESQFVHSNRATDLMISGLLII